MSACLILVQVNVSTVARGFAENELGLGRVDSLMRWSWKKGIWIAEQILKNTAMAIPAVAAWRSRRGRTSMPGAGDSHLENSTYAPYRMVVDAVGESNLEGCAIGEVGPGDQIPAAILFLGAGARMYVAFDRFRGDISSEGAKKLYAILFQDLQRRFPKIYSRLKSAGIAPNRFPEGYPSLIRYEHRQIESDLGEYNSAFDVLFSNNVVEHVVDIDKFAKNIYQLLRPSGVAVHRVDFGPHDTWQKIADPFEWLTVSDFIWTLMGSQRGVPNRKRFHEVCLSLEDAGFALQVFKSELYPEELVRDARPSLARRFRTMPVESLRVKTAFLECRKTSGSRLAGHVAH